MLRLTQRRLLFPVSAFFSRAVLRVPLTEAKFKASTFAFNSGAVRLRNSKNELLLPRRSSSSCTNKSLVQLEIGYVTPVLIVTQCLTNSSACKVKNSFFFFLL